MRNALTLWVLVVSCVFPFQAAFAQDREPAPPAAVAEPASADKSVEVEITLLKLKAVKLSETAGQPMAFDLNAALQEWDEADRILAMDQLRFVVVEGRKAQVQYGANTPVVTSTQFSGRGGQPVRSFRMEQSGLLVNTSASVESDGAITLDLDLQCSSLDSAPADGDITSDAENPPQLANETPAAMRTTQISSAVRVKGKAIVIGRRLVIEGDERTEYLALAFAKVSE